MSQEKKQFQLFQVADEDQTNAAPPICGIKKINCGSFRGGCCPGDNALEEILSSRNNFDI